MPGALGYLVETGFANALTYDTYRPSYPTESVTKLLEKMNVLDLPQARIVDIGAGTGKLTEQLVAMKPGFQIVAVEPHVHMRKVLDNKGLPGVRVLNGTATSLDDIETGWADGVVVAQAFHWFSNLDALQAIHRILKSNGTLSLIWNFEDYNSGVEWKSSTQWEDKMKKLLWAHDNHRKWQSTFADQPQPPLFSPIQGHIQPWTVWLTKEGVWDRFRTISRIAALARDELETTKQTVFNAMNGEDVETDGEGRVALHGRTELYWATASPNKLNWSL